MIHATYCLTEEDLLEARTKHGGFLLRIGQGLGVAILGLGIYLAATQPSSLAGLQIFIGLVLIFRLWLLNKLLYKRANFGETEIDADDERIEFRTPQGTSSVKWDAVMRSMETKNLFLIYPQRNYFNLLPKRALSPEGISGIRVWLKRGSK